MRHFIQYHNPDRFKPYKSSKVKARIVTNKRVEKMVGDTVWLVSRRGRLAQFVLCDPFVVDEIRSNEPGALKNVASGARGYWFVRAVFIDQKPWFGELRRATGNFLFGLQSIRDGDVIRGLEDLAASNGIRRSSSPKSIAGLLMGGQISAF
jgi:hypothetical protein